MSENYTLTAVEGLLVGHATSPHAATGCTVILCPPRTLCAVAHRGGGLGTREINSLKVGSLIECVDAIALAGGSVFGLSVADGVLRYLCEQKRGINTAGGLVPIVPTAVIYDLLLQENDIYPDAKMGYEACLNASFEPLTSGALGAGKGATICKHGGLKTARKAGIGNAGIKVNDHIRISIMLVVNAFGNIVNSPKEISQAELSLMSSTHDKARCGENTVLGVVATNASLNKEELSIVAHMAQSGLARAIVPCHTPFDGDTIFALSTGTKPYDVFSLGVAAQRLAQEAVYDALIKD
jgi:L-aminopeptidase/D-esterase-like protein